MVRSGTPSGCVMTNDFSGGLRGLRPPATFWQPFGLRLVKELGSGGNRNQPGSNLRFVRFLKELSALVAKELFVLVGCQVGASPKQLSEVTGMSRSAVSRRCVAARLKIEKKHEWVSWQRASGNAMAALIKNRTNRKPDPGWLVLTNDFSGGLRGLRPPATFWQPFGLRLVRKTEVRPAICDSPCDHS